jgi:hypothetical protein
VFWQKKKKTDDINKKKCRRSAGSAAVAAAGDEGLLVAGEPKAETLTFHLESRRRLSDLRSRCTHEPSQVARSRAPENRYFKSSILLWKAL